MEPAAFNTISVPSEASSTFFTLYSAGRAAEAAVAFQMRSYIACPFADSPDILSGACAASIFVGWMHSWAPCDLPSVIFFCQDAFSFSVVGIYRSGYAPDMYFRIISSVSGNFCSRSVLGYVVSPSSKRFCRTDVTSAEESFRIFIPSPMAVERVSAGFLCSWIFFSSYFEQTAFAAKRARIFSASFSSLIGWLRNSVPSLSLYTTTQYGDGTKF